MGKKIHQKKQSGLKGGGEQSFFQQSKKDQPKTLHPEEKIQFLKLSQFIMLILVPSILNRSGDKMINWLSEFTPDTFKIDIVQLVQKFAKTNVNILISLKQYLQKKMSQTLLQNTEFYNFCKQLLKYINDYLYKNSSKGRSQFLSQNINSDRSPGYDQRLYEKKQQTQKKIKSKFVVPKYDFEYQKMKGNDN